MKITVLVPTYRRPDDLRRCLDALKTQERSADQVIVTVREDDAETAAFFAGYTAAPLPLHLVPVTVPGVIAAMNAGLAQSTGDIIALTDDDTAPYKDWLQRIEAHYAADPQVGGVGGRDWQAHDHRNFPVVGKVHWVGRVIGNHHLGYGPAREVDLLKGANCAYRAEPLKRIGFDTRLLGSGAQVHWELALGLALRRDHWKLIYDPAVAIEHYPASRFDEDQRGKFDWQAHQNAVYNEGVALLTYLPFGRRLIYIVFVFLLGSLDSPGLLQVPRLLLQRSPNLRLRLGATLTGRVKALYQIMLHPKQTQLKRPQETFNEV